MLFYHALFGRFARFGLFFDPHGEASEPSLLIMTSHQSRGLGLLVYIVIRQPPAYKVVAQILLVLKKSPIET